MGRVRLCPCYLGTALASGHFPGELKACDRAREALTVGRRGALRRRPGPCGVCSQPCAPQPAARSTGRGALAPGRPAPRDREGALLLSCGDTPLIPYRAAPSS